MCGGQTSQTTQSVQIPPEVLQRYSAVNTRAESVANTPFQQYSTDPNAFVAPLNSTQNAGISGTNAAANLAQPYYSAASQGLGGAQDVGNSYANAATSALYGANQAAAGQQSAAAQAIGQSYGSAQPYNQAALAQYYQGLGAAQPLNQAANQNIQQAQQGAQPYQALATGLGLGAAQAVNPTQLNGQAINQYMSPYLNSVVGSTAALLNQQNQQAQSGQLGNAIQQHAFGGDRAGIAAANLAQQQNLSNANIFSGLLNTGYNNALGAAQQQQGVNLSADQANRAALGAASGNLASIGQQGFGQGITTAQQQAALGQQQFGQNQTTGQNVQGLGNSIYSQGLGQGQAQAALGNQLFGQGAQTSQQLAALGQQQFGQGLAASQQNAALGTGAQGAALQGAQAQLSAGQVAQQTQQAGQTALYNQFLQQQSYPFQVSQFLANIAEGTGALSGSTTTTTQPGGFFSDERLKEGVQKIGETFDGQNIVKFKYKGDPNWRMGLVAQEVEKHHPDAVSESHGYKAVDYGKATEEAAKRGKFADGGVPGGFDPTLMQQILANSQGMYGPYMTALGGAGPYGGAGRVPAANLPVGQLKVAGDLPQQASPMAKAKEVADVSNSVLQTGEGLKKKWDTFEEARKKNTTASADEGIPYARGGLAGFADGGMPYGQQVAGGLDIPNEKPDLKLATPGSPGSQESGLSKVGSAAGTALAVAKLAALLMNQGGAVKDRHGYATDGSVDDLSGSDGSDVLAGGSGKDTIPASERQRWIDAAEDVNRGIRAGNRMGQNRPLATPEDMYNQPIPSTYRHVVQEPLANFGEWLSGNKPGAQEAAKANFARINHENMGNVGNEVRSAMGLGAASPPPAQHPTVEAQPHQVGATGSWSTPGATGSWDAPAPSHAAPLARSAGLAGSLHAAPSHPNVPANRATPSGRNAAPAGLGAVRDALMASQPISEQAITPDVLSAANPNANVTLNTPQDVTLDKEHRPIPGLGALESIKGSPIGGYFKHLKEGDMPTWVSLLSGIGAMGTAPTRHLGVALASGLTGGTEGYMGARKAQSAMAQQAAQTGFTKASTGLTESQTWNQMQERAGPGMVMVKGVGPNGESILGPNGEPWHRQMLVAGTDYSGKPTPQSGASNVPGATPTAPAVNEVQKVKAPVPTVAPSTETDNYMHTQYGIDPSQPAVANHDRAIALNPELAAQNEAARAAIEARKGNLQEADTTRRQLMQLSEAYNQLSRSSLTGQGQGSAYRANLANMYTTVAGMFGVPVDPSVTKDVSEHQIIAKIKELSGAALAHQYGERAASIAHSISNVLPGGDLQPAAAQELLSQMMVQSQQPLDFSQYTNNYVNRYGLAVGAEPAFQRDAQPSYGREQRSLKSFIASPGYTAAVGDLQSSDPKVQQRAADTLDRIYGPGFHRYFTGGQ